MKKSLTYLLIGAALILLQTAPAFSHEDNDDGPPPARPPRPIGLSARLGGLPEVPSVSTTGSGQFRATVNADRTEISWSLSYDNTEGEIFMAHIHFGQQHTNGGISVWFCGDPDSPSPPPPSVPAGLPICPLSGTLEGSFTAADVIGPAGQGIAAGEFEEFVNAILSGATYVNVHSLKHPPGEIRGQIDSRRFGPR
ncbi:MAG: CHRD domain-containing protein [Candidatus Manganitrophus sp. SB1]|nr:CHRD domain-containing protein [Candidatus Manganitrophus morganii]